jgi:hypothetical protein
VAPRRVEALGGRQREGPAPTVGVLVYRGVSTAEIDIPVTVLADRLGAHVLFVGVESGMLPGVEPSRRKHRCPTGSSYRVGSAGDG